ncbi:MAG: DUF342 domain-containing protein [Burkholderiaceae bacterium]|nr:DUF342 domain-containing protein [Burkholderiaceae bacterium]
MADHESGVGSSEGAPQAASIQVALAADHMSAEVTLDPGNAAMGIELTAVLSALAQAGVSHGVCEDALAAACAACAGGDVKQVRAAVGDMVQEGEDARFELLIAEHRERAPKLDAHGMIDFREQGEVPMVEVGQALMRRIPATAGRAGRDVCGQVLPARAGNDEPFSQPLVGAAPDIADANLLRATVRGQPVRLGNAVMVEPVFRIKEVNMATGNVHFDGTVQIDGDILPGMLVQASGDILVQGTIEGGVLEARGDIRAQGGAIAKSRLSADGSVMLRFVETSSVKAGLAIVIEDMALHSDLHAGAQITVGENSRQRGRLAGGTACAKMRIKVPQLGVPGAGLTRVQVGVDPELNARLAVLLTELDVHKQEADKLEKLVQLLSKNDPKGVLPRVQAAWQQALQVWGKALQEKEAIENQLALVLEARVETTVGVQGELDLSLGRQHVLLTRSFGTGYFSMQEDGSLSFTDATQSVVRLA